MKRLAFTTLALALTAASGSVFAYQNGYGYGDNNGYDDNGTRYDVAQVTRVDPIIDRSRPSSHQECWVEPASGYSQYDNSRYDNRYYNRNGYRSNSGVNGGAVIGAIVGGALGNQTGHGDGRKAATIAGIAIGAAIGNQVHRSNDRRYGYDSRYPNGYYDQNQGVQHCRIVNDYADDERVQGYNVTYRYAGQTYHTVTAYHPGSTIRVQVDVTPIDRGVASTY
jgi:uncharacterized protein YcfJ